MTSTTRKGRSCISWRRKNRARIDRGSRVLLSHPEEGLTYSHVTPFIRVSCLLVLLEIVPYPQFRLGLFVLVGEIGFPARAEAYMPAPEATERRFGIPVVVGAELAVLAGVLCHVGDMLNVIISNILILYGLCANLPFYSSRIFLVFRNLSLL